MSILPDTNTQRNKFHALVSSLDPIIQINGLVVSPLGKIEIVDILRQRRAESNGEFGLEVANLDKRDKMRQLLSETNASESAMK